MRHPVQQPADLRCRKVRVRRRQDVLLARRTGDGILVANETLDGGSLPSIAAAGTIVSTDAIATDSLASVWVFGRFDTSIDLGGGKSFSGSSDTGFVARFDRR
jgi:hypothetical protein